GVAGVNEVQRAVLTEESVAVNGGEWMIEWVTPNGSEYTETFAYNASTAVIKGHIEGLRTFDGEITVSATLTAAATPVDFTFGGNYSFKPMWENGYRIIVHSVNANDDGVLSFASMRLQTPGVEGFNSGGSHTVNIIAWTTNLLTLRNGN